MREAIGGTWILGFVVLFIVLFSGYLAVSVNYTKAFKVKNKIINIIEESEGYTSSNSIDLDTTSLDVLKSSYTARERIYAYLIESGYKTTVINEDRCPNGSYQKGGYCVEKILTTDNYPYYRVTTFIKIEIPIVWFNITVPITGDTKVLYNAVD